MPLDIPRIRAICFDVDGTLSDTDDVLVERLARGLSPLSFLFPQRNPQPFARWAVMAAESPGNVVYATLDRLHLDTHLAPLMDAMARRRRERHPHKRHFSLAPGAAECVAALAQRYPLAVVSARDEGTTMAFLDHFGLLPYFRCVASALTCRHTKPFPHPILWAAEQMGVPPGATLMVGDTTVDIRAGRAAGAQTVGVLCGFGQEGELRRAGADVVLESTGELVGALEATQGRS